ncbi:hypothetical protein EV424DRAFT_1541451 [Suillus variegatus]|nr:hypothetical protein EV424DRAFT_1541451 [Suillus variegatus]
MESNSRPRRKAKDQALDNPVWEPLKARSKQPHKREVSTSDKVRPVPTDRVKSGKTPSHRTKTTVTALPVKNKRDPKGCKRPLFALSDSDSEEEARMWRQSKTRKARKLEPEPDSDTSKQGGVSDASKSEDSESEAEPADSIAKGLLAEIPTIARHSSHLKKPHQRQPATASPSPEATKSSQTPPPPIWGSQLKPMNARERRQAAEVPLWDPIMTSSSFGPQGPTAPVNKTNRFFSDESILVEDEAEDEAEDDYNLTLNIKSEPHSADESEAEPHEPTKSLH